MDRDGTVIHDRHYLSEPEGVELLPTAGEAIARLNRAGIPVVLVTNQSGIGRGLFTEADFQAVQVRLADLLARAGARLDAVYHCPHAPGHGPPCECRKPGVELFVRAAGELGLRLRGSFFIGDRARDVDPAHQLGGHAILVVAGRTEKDPEEPRPGTRTVNTLEEAVDQVLAELRSD